MGEVTLPCFLISLPKAIFVIARLVGPFSEKNCDRDLENAARALRPRAAFSVVGKPGYRIHHLESTLMVIILFTKTAVSDRVEVLVCIYRTTLITEFAQTSMLTKTR